MRLQCPCVREDQVKRFDDIGLKLPKSVTSGEAGRTKTFLIFLTDLKLFYVK